MHILLPMSVNFQSVFICNKGPIGNCVMKESSGELCLVLTGSLSCTF